MDRYAEKDADVEFFEDRENIVIKVKGRIIKCQADGELFFSEGDLQVEPGDTVP